MTLALIICALLVGHHLLQTVASLLSLKASRQQPPDSLSDIYDEKEYARSQEYTRTNIRFDLLTSTFNLAVLLVFWFAGGFAWLQNFSESWNLGPLWTGVGVIALLVAAQHLISIPFDLYDTFVLEERFGFNKKTWKTWLGDEIRTLLLMAILGIPLLLTLLWILHTLPQAWLWAWITMTAFSLGLTYLAPTLILPLFNKFTPMPEGPLRRRIEAIAERCGFPLKEVFIIDGSRRSTKANAFFTGFGKHKKIALYDTLVENQSEEEIAAVLAHEIGHFKHGHIRQRIALSILTTGVFFFLLGLVIDNPTFLAAFGVDADAAITPLHFGLFFFLLLLTPVSTLLGIFTNALSRKHEFQADAFAKRALGSAEPLLSALKKLSAQNLGNLTPHPLRVTLDYSHPPLAERFAALKSA